MIEVSIIVVNWNTKEILRNCIDSINKETKDLNFDIIVVDNGSTDGSAAMVKKEFPLVKLIRNKKNLGFAAANNQGIKRAKGEYILLLNSDTIILNNAIGKTLTFMKKRKDAGVVGCKLLNDDYTLQPSCYNFYSFFKRVIVRKFVPKFIIPRKYHINLESLITSWDYDEIRDVDYVRGAFLMVRSDVFQQIGMLDKSFFMYGEEKDFCVRMKRKGFKVYFYPGASIIHLKGSSVERKTTEVLQRIISSLLFRRKHYSIFGYFVLRFFLLLNVILKYSLVKLSGRDERKLRLEIKKIEVICKMNYHDIK